MSLEEDLSHLSPAHDSALTIGVFDGVHRGHRHLIGALVEEARASGLLAGVVTFKNHPVTVLRPGTRVRFLTDVTERTRLLKGLGVDFVAAIEFDLALARLPSREFLRVLYRDLRMRKLVVGPDFAMGRNRDGSVETLPGLASDIGFEFKSVDLITDPSGLVKSTAIRKQIADGQVSGVAHLLGRNFSVHGTVVQGQKRGRELGFPTANLDVDSNLIIPCDGIYATLAHLESGSYMAATSIGLRPTFDDGESRTIEAFLLDFSEDIYGQKLRLEFVQRLRGEEKYDTVEALLVQIDKDVQQTRAALSQGDTLIKDSK